MDWIFRVQTGDAHLRRELLGALIGLARATDGNEHMLRASTAAVTAEALTSLGNESADFRALIRAVGEEKRKLVPDCFLCAAPCGRTRDFDVSALGNEEEPIRVLKEKLVSGLCKAAESAQPTLLYRVLFSLGCDDWEEAELVSLLREVEAAEC